MSEDEVISSMDGSDDGDETATATGMDDTSEATFDDDEEENNDISDVGFKFGTVSRDTLKGLQPHEMLKKWSEVLMPIEVDLISELNASNLFFINVESVICNMILTKEISFQEDTQFLRLTYAVEQLLSSIQNCGGVFRLIFFDCAKKLFAQAFPDSVWAFRQAFLAHCKETGVDHSEFPHWYGSAFKEHVQEWRPSLFLVAHDFIELEDPDEEDEDEDPVVTAQLRGFFQAMMLSCLSFRTHVVLLRGMQRRGNRVMAFALEPDYYNPPIDKEVREAFTKTLEAEDEEEEEDEDVGKELASFAERAGGKAKPNALLRSFLSCRWARETLEMCEGENPQTRQLMQLVVKALFLQEAFVRYIKLDKRSFNIPAVEDWPLFEESISSALDRYFSKMADDLEKVMKSPPEGVPLHAADMFDGRLYQYIFHLTITKGFAAKGKLDADFFKLQDWVLEEVEFLWSESGSSEPFFPIVIEALKGLPNIQPPDIPARLPPMSKPELADIKSDFLEALWEDATFKDMSMVEATEMEEENVLWAVDDDPEAKTHKWNRYGQIDSFKEEENMDDNEAEKAWKAKQAEKKKTAYDIEYQRKFALKKRQLALRALSQYAKSLTGSDKLHPPIIMKTEKEKEKEKEAEKEREKATVGKKQQEILDKRKLEDAAKLEADDAIRLKEKEPAAEKLAETLDLAKLQKDLLDFCLGFTRITDSFVGFPGITAGLKTPEAQSKLLLKVVKSVRTALKKMQLEKLAQSQQPQARQLVGYFFCLLQELMNSYGKRLDGKGIKQVQEALICIGFPKVAGHAFETWLDFKAKEAEAAAKASENDKDKGKDDKKKGKDDKKDKKDDKKDKKDDKKDKKDKKDTKDDDDEKGPESYKVTKEVELVWSGVGSDEYAFQLMYLGPHMARTVGTAKDPLGRVTFKPDGWQRQLLDIVDSKQSSLVVAPTASGKTFVGYYVMDKVLREDNDGVAVYVAPSKALVNQVSAEIYARFSSKNYPPNSKHELLGSFLREFNTAGGVAEQGKWKNCQILVTIPHILEMLLMSRTNQDWVKRLKWIVFDEVHCIGEQAGGVQWEHNFQMIPCPFIALSATVADPSFFHGWLGSLAKQKSLANVDLVIHTERWNDLYKFVFVDGALRPLHPFCALVEKVVRANGLASDMTLTPQEMIQLFQEVKRIIGKHGRWDELLPSTWFGKDVGFVSKGDARKYEKRLKGLFLELLKEDTLTGEHFSGLVLALQNTPDLDIEMLGGKGSSKFTPPSRTQQDENTDMLQLVQKNSYLQASTLVDLCRKLDKSEYLPAIIFNFSTKDIEKMLDRLVKELKDQQWNKYYGTEEAAWKSKRIMEARHKEYEAKKKAYEEALKAKGNKNQEGKAARKTGGDEDGRGNNNVEAADTAQDQMADEPEPVIELADQIDAEFSFHSPKALGQWQEDIEEELEKLAQRKTPQYLIDALRRGIAIHHEGLKRNYTLAVEILFRRGFLRIVLATGTLALGINMPCRSTIFCGSSTELNGLMFRQMSGRAGRRGFDLLGQVVFLDMGFTKVRSLIASELPTLTGVYTLSPTILLRALQMWKVISTDEVVLQSKEQELPRSREDIAKCLRPMFELPFFKSKTAELETQTMHYTRFTVEFLYRQGLLDVNGVPTSMANLVVHLFEIEPANFILSRLLSRGLLHNYLKAEKKKMVKADRSSHLTVKLTGVLAWFLFRRRLPELIPTERKERKKHLPSKGSPALPKLPSEILAEVLRYSESTFEIFQQLSWTVASTRKIKQGDLTLPFSGIEFPADWDARGEPFQKGDGSFFEGYVGQITRYRARSPFSALSGSGDHFKSPQELVNGVRNVLHMDLNALPMVLPAAGKDDALEATNSWAVDFMIHGSRKYLYEDNGIESTATWKLISEFIAKLNMAVAVIKVFAPKDDIVLVTMLELIAEMDERLSPKAPTGGAKKVKKMNAK